MLVCLQCTVTIIIAAQQEAASISKNGTQLHQVCGCICIQVVPSVKVMNMVDIQLIRLAEVAACILPCKQRALAAMLGVAGCVLPEWLLVDTQLALQAVTSLPVGHRLQSCLHDMRNSLMQQALKPIALILKV